MTVLSGPNANPNLDYLYNPKFLTLSSSLLTLTIYLTRSRPVWTANYGRWWSGVVGGDFNQTSDTPTIISGSNRSAFMVHCGMFWKYS